MNKVCYKHQMSNNTRMLFGMMHRSSGKKDYENIEPVKKQEITTPAQPSTQEDNKAIIETPVRPSEETHCGGGMYHASSGRMGFQTKK